MADLEHTYFLRDLSGRELDKVRAITRSRRFATDEPIVQLGERVTQLHVIESGSVRVIVPVEGQKGTEEQALATLGPGDCFGEFSFVDRQPASASVVANETTRVFLIAHTDLDELLAGDAYLARKLLAAMLRTIVGRFRSTDANLALTRYVLQYV